MQTLKEKLENIENMDQNIIEQLLSSFSTLTFSAKLSQSEIKDILQKIPYKAILSNQGRKGNDKEYDKIYQKLATLDIDHKLSLDDYEKRSRQDKDSLSALGKTELERFITSSLQHYTNSHHIDGIVEYGFNNPENQADIFSKTERRTIVEFGLQYISEETDFCNYLHYVLGIEHATAEKLTYYLRTSNESSINKAEKVPLSNRGIYFNTSSSETINHSANEAFQVPERVSFLFKTFNQVKNLDEKYSILQDRLRNKYVQNNRLVRIDIPFYKQSLLGILKEKGYIGKDLSIDPFSTLVNLNIETPIPKEDLLYHFESKISADSYTEYLKNEYFINIPVKNNK